MSSTPANLTISAVSAETGVSIAALRAWEARHGFPSPVRLPGGHRRFSDRQVEQIRQVQRDRAGGLSLEVAIRRALVGDRATESTIFAGLRGRWPELPVHVLSKRTLTAISRAIEDECCVHAERPAVVGCFQRERYYRQSEDRWQEIARTASSAMVFADFPKTRRRRGAATEISVAPDSTLLREWAVVCDAPNFAACVAGVERPGPVRGAHRRYETVWTVDPAVVRDATALAAVLAQRGPAGGVMVTAPQPPGTDPAALLRAGTALLNRIVAYLDA